MIEEFQRLLDRYVKKTEDGYRTKPDDRSRYIIRFFSTPASGFGSMSTGKLELYLRLKGLSLLRWSTEVKGKTDEVEELACQELFNWLLEGHLNYGNE